MRVLSGVQTVVMAEIRQEAKGHVGEGYRGGYNAALSDVILWLNGCDPMDHRGYWAEAIRKINEGR
jgi:hypothetical protein